VRADEGFEGGEAPLVAEGPKEADRSEAQGGLRGGRGLGSSLPRIEAKSCKAKRTESAKLHDSAKLSGHA
jgi:hypothetical protein